MAPKGDYQFITNQLIEKGYDYVFKSLNDMENYDHFEKFILYLKENVTILIKPSKEQLFILHRLFKLFSKEEDILILHTLVISLYSDYLPTCHSPLTKQCFMYEDILDMILTKGSFDNYKLKLSKSTIITSLIDTNFNSFDNEMIKIFIEKLLNHVVDEHDPEMNLDIIKMVFLIITLLLKLKENGCPFNDEEEIKLFKNVEIVVQKYLKSKVFNQVIFTVLNILAHQSNDQIIKTAVGHSNSNEFSITSNATNYILETCSGSGGGFDESDDFGVLCLVLLLFQTRANSKIFQKKMKNEIIKGAIEFFNQGDDNQIGFREILNLLIDNQQFDLISIKNLISPYKDDINPNQIRPDDLVGRLPLDLSISIFSILLRDKKIKKNKIREFLGKKIYLIDLEDSNNEYDDGTINNNNQIKSIFNINENQFHHYDEFILFEIYEKYFEKIIQTIDLESILPSLFNNLENSPIKFKIIKSKLNYFIQSLNYNSISNFITSTKQPYFIEKCEKSKIYNLKKIENYLFKQQDNSSSSTPAPAVPVLSNVLIQEIILKYVDNKSTSMYQKLQISLVSKRFYEIVKGFINSSTTTPVLINVKNFDFVGNFYRHSREMATMNKSLITKDVKYVEMDFALSENSRDTIKYLCLILNSCKSLEILHIIDLDVGYNQLFAYLCWFKSLKKLIIQMVMETYEYSKLYKLITNLENSRTTTTTSTRTKKTTTTTTVNPIKILLSMYSFDGPSQLSKINFSKFYILSIPIEEYFRHSSFKEINCLNELDLVIGAHIETPDMIKYCKKHLAFKDDETFDKLEILSIQILGLPYGEIYGLFNSIFKFFRNKSKNIKEFKILINLENTNNSKNSTLESAISIIFKLLSSPNLIGFQNLKQITISNYESQLQSLKNIDSFNFKQRIFNETTINSFEFIKQQQEESKDEANQDNVGSSDDDSDLEGFEFNTDSGNYSEDEEDDDDENEYDYDDEGNSYTDDNS